VRTPFRRRRVWPSCFSLPGGPAWLSFHVRLKHVPPFFLSIAVLLSHAPGSWAGPASTPDVLIQRVAITTNKLGQECAIITLTNPSPTHVLITLHSVDYKVSGRWVTNQSVPAIVTADLAAPAVDVLAPGQTLVCPPVRFPTNATWRLRFRVWEQRQGVIGSVEKVKARVEGIVENRPPSDIWAGRTYTVETPDIVP